MSPGRPGNRYDHAVQAGNCGRRESFEPHFFLPNAVHTLNLAEPWMRSDVHPLRPRQVLFSTTKASILEERKVSDTSLIVSYLVMPSDTNPAGNVHGGVIMKHIDNTAGIVAYRHARANVVTASIDRLDFHNPAFVGELLTLKASLNYVGRSSMEIGVRVEAENLLSGEVRHIASAYLTFVSLDEQHRPKAVPPVSLETEEACRRNKEAIERNRSRKLEKQKERNRSHHC